jgi:hypothetical protein
MAVLSHTTLLYFLGLSLLFSCRTALHRFFFLCVSFHPDPTAFCPLSPFSFPLNVFPATPLCLVLRFLHQWMVLGRPNGKYLPASLQSSRTHYRYISFPSCSLDIPAHLFPHLPRSSTCTIFAPFSINVT